MESHSFPGCCQLSEATALLAEEQGFSPDGWTPLGRRPIKARAHTSAPPPPTPPCAPPFPSLFPFSDRFPSLPFPLLLQGKGHLPTFLLHAGDHYAAVLRRGPPWGAEEAAAGGGPATPAGAAGAAAAALLPAAQSSPPRAGTPPLARATSERARTPPPASPPPGGRAGAAAGLPRSVSENSPPKPVGLRVGGGAASPVHAAAAADAAP